MSDFLVGVVRRGAGHAAVVEPRRPEFPLRSGPPEWATLEETPAAIRPASADVPSEASTAAPAVERAAAGRTPTATRRRSPSRPGAHDPRPGSGADVVRPIVPGVRDARAPVSRASSGSPAPSSVARPPEVIRSREEPPLESRGIEASATPVVAADAVASAGRRDPVLPDRIEPRALALQGPARPGPGTVRLPPTRRSADSDTPRVEVQIGRIEIIQPQLPRPAARPRRMPRGFAGLAVSRRYHDRRWY